MRASFLDFLTYAGFLAAAFAIDYYHKDRRRAEEVQQLQLHAAWLQSELSQAQLVALRGQVHPHFLFNAFNAISTLVRQQRNEAAVGMIAQLSSLLRMSMETIEEPSCRSAASSTSSDRTSRSSGSGSATA